MRNNVYVILFLLISSFSSYGQFVPDYTFYVTSINFDNYPTVVGEFVLATKHGKRASPELGQNLLIKNRSAPSEKLGASIDYRPGSSTKETQVVIALHSLKREHNRDLLTVLANSPGIFDAGKVELAFVTCNADSLKQSEFSSDFAEIQVAIENIQESGPKYCSERDPMVIFSNALDMFDESKRNVLLANFGELLVEGTDLRENEDTFSGVELFQIGGSLKQSQVLDFCRSTGGGLFNADMAQPLDYSSGMPFVLQTIFNDAGWKSTFTYTMTDCLDYLSTFNNLFFTVDYDGRRLGSFETTIDPPNEHRGYWQGASFSEFTSNNQVDTLKYQVVQPELIYGIVSSNKSFEVGPLYGSHPGVSLPGDTILFYAKYIGNFDNYERAILRVQSSNCLTSPYVVSNSRTLEISPSPNISSNLHAFDSLPIETYIPLTSEKEARVRTSVQGFKGSTSGKTYYSSFKNEEGTFLNISRLMSDVDSLSVSVWNEPLSDSTFPIVSQRKDLFSPEYPNVVAVSTNNENTLAVLFDGEWTASNISVDTTERSVSVVLMNSLLNYVSINEHRVGFIARDICVSKLGGYVIVGHSNVTGNESVEDSQIVVAKYSDTGEELWMKTVSHSRSGRLEILTMADGTYACVFETNISENQVEQEETNLHLISLSHSGDILATEIIDYKSEWLLDFATSKSDILLLVASTNQEFDNTQRVALLHKYNSDLELQWRVPLHHEDYFCDFKSMCIEPTGSTVVATANKKLNKLLLHRLSINGELTDSIEMDLGFIQNSISPLFFLDLFPMDFGVEIHFSDYWQGTTLQRVFVDSSLDHIFTWSSPSKEFPRRVVKFGDHVVSLWSNSEVEQDYYVVQMERSLSGGFPFRDTTISPIYVRQPRISLRKDTFDVVYPILAESYDWDFARIEPDFFMQHDSIFYNEEEYDVAYSISDSFIKGMFWVDSLLANGGSYGRAFTDLSPNFLSKDSTRVLEREIIYGDTAATFYVKVRRGETQFPLVFSSDSLNVLLTNQTRDTLRSVIQVWQDTRFSRGQRIDLGTVTVLPREAAEYLSVRWKSTSDGVLLGGEKEEIEILLAPKAPLRFSAKILVKFGDYDTRLIPVSYRGFEYQQTVFMSIHENCVGRIHVRNPIDSDLDSLGIQWISYTVSVPIEIVDTNSLAPEVLVVNDNVHFSGRVNISEFDREHLFEFQCANFNQNELPFLARVELIDQICIDKKGQQLHRIDTLRDPNGQYGSCLFVYSPCQQDTTSELQFADGAVHVYPNPVVDHCIVELQDSDHDILELLLFTAEGEFVKRLDIDSQYGKKKRVYVDTRGIGTGLYFLVRRSSTGASASQIRVVK